MSQQQLTSSCSPNKEYTDETTTNRMTSVDVPLLQKHTTTTTTTNNTFITESLATLHITIPMILTGLLLYSRSIISVLFLGRLGDDDLPLAGGSLAVGFANITGYSILSGLAMGMEPICGQAFGSRRHHKLLGSTLQKTIILLLITSIPISLLWVSVEKILLLCNQNPSISTQAQIYLVYSLPDLILQSFLHPIRIYLRSQSITLPLTLCAGFATLLHFPINYFLVNILGLGIRGVAIGSVVTNFNTVVALILYILINKLYKSTWGGLISFHECFQFKTLLKLAIPSCVSVCLEWWWYEIMILLCGLLPNPTATVGSMGILIQTTALIYIFPSSLSYGISTRVGNHLGAGRPDKAKRSAITGVFMGLIVGLTALYFAVSVRHKWALMFTDDKDIVGLTSIVLPIIGLCELGNCPQTAGCGVLRGTARPKIGARLNLGCFYLIGMPVAVWFGFYGGGYGFKGLWIGLMAAQWSCVVVMMWVVVFRTDWALMAKRAGELANSSSSSSTSSDDDNDKDNDQTVVVVVEEKEKEACKFVV